MIFLSLVKLPESWEKCETELERILYLVKNMEEMTSKSKPYEIGDYNDIFTASATGNLTREEAVAYSQSYYRLKEQESAIRFAEKKAEARGMEKGMEKGEKLGLREMLRMNVKSMREKGLTNETIANFLNQPLDLISSL